MLRFLKIIQRQSRSCMKDTPNLGFQVPRKISFPDISLAWEEHSYDKPLTESERESLFSSC